MFPTRRCDDPCLPVARLLGQAQLRTGVVERDARPVIGGIGFPQRGQVDLVGVDFGGQQGCEEPDVA